MDRGGCSGIGRIRCHLGGQALHKKLSWSRRFQLHSSRLLHSGGRKVLSSRMPEASGMPGRQPRPASAGHGADVWVHLFGQEAVFTSSWRTRRVQIGRYPSPLRGRHQPRLATHSSGCWAANALVPGQWHEASHPRERSPTRTHSVAPRQGLSLPLSHSAVRSSL